MGFKVYFPFINNQEEDLIIQKKINILEFKLNPHQKLMMIGLELQLLGNAQ